MSTNIMDALPVYPDEPTPPPPKRRPFGLHPNFPWAVLWCVGMVFFTQVPGGVVALVLIFGLAFAFPKLLPMDSLKTPADLMQNPAVLACLAVALVVSHLLIIAMSLTCLRVIAGRDWRREVALRLPRFSHVLLVLALVPAFMVLANVSSYFFAHVLHFPSLFKEFGLTNADDLEGAFKGPVVIIIAAFIIGVMPGLSEELWCRAFLGRGLVGKHGYLLGVLGTSVLFGVIHLDPVQGSMAMVVGVLLHYVYLTSRSLLIPMLLHFLNNSLSVGLGGVEEWQKIVPNNTLPAWPVLAAAAALLAAVCFALYQSRARLVTLEGAIPWQPPYPGVVCPPRDSATIVHAPAPSLASVTLVLLSLIAFAAAGYAVVGIAPALNVG